MSQVDIADLENMIQGYLNLIRTTRSNIENPAFVERQLASYQAVIDKHVKLRDELIATRDNAEQIIIDAKQRVRELKQQLLRLKRKRDIERLLALQAQVNALTNGEEVSDDD